MRPIKLLSAISLARYLGVTRVVEEGRYGGLSAYMYDMHGFNVTSIEFLPLDDVTQALRRLVPTVELRTADGHEETPAALQAVDPARDRVMVIFDGTKRFDAYGTFEKIRDKVAFAIFDNTNIGNGMSFREHLAEKGEVVWSTDDASYNNLTAKESPILKTLLSSLPRSQFFGGVNQLWHLHFTIVQGGAYNPAHCRPRKAQAP
mmetsp:Transcript_34563/g.107368  ORF Transcript_34563/g.107368 Transcript_34563/m.107368 type:complete len:204 (-) Transcript_34563:43-654(-)